jgi:hypothetical protein
MLTIVLVICIPIFILPNLSNNLKNYTKGEGTLINARIHEREYTGRYFTKKVETTLILNLNNNVSIVLNDQYNDYWSTFLDRRSIGKKLTYYLGNNKVNKHLNPVQIVLDDKIVYDPSQNRTWEYILVLITVGCVIYSSKKYYTSKIKRRLD